jgi:hypothetical protein
LTSPSRPCRRSGDSSPDPQGWTCEP